MDFASLQCTLTKPRCLFCPIREWCLAAPSAQRGDLRERRVAEQSEPYAVSSRYYRGRIVALLGRLGEGEAIDAEEIDRLLTAENAQDQTLTGDRSRLERLILGLVRDGLVAENLNSPIPQYSLAR